MMNYCGECRHRDAEGYCTSDKLEEEWNRKRDDDCEYLIYSYPEDGRFWVGPKFGCVHFEKKIDNT